MTLFHIVYVEIYEDLFKLHILVLVAPSAPTDVSVRLIKSPVVEVTWKEPIDHYGIITTYIVYSNAPNVSLSTGPNTFHQTSLENSVVSLPLKYILVKAYFYNICR